MPVTDVHTNSLATSTYLSGYYMKHAIPPEKVIAVLNNAGISFVLVGLHGIGGWMKKPRATEDVDVVVAAKHLKKAVKALLSTFPQLEARDLEVVTRLVDREAQNVAVDVIKPTQPLFRAIFKHTHSVRTEAQSYRIPSLEMALALKFAPMVSLTRDDLDKHQDVHDFGYIARTNPDINFAKLAELGDLVYPGGGQEIVEKVRQVRAGEKLTL
jgi:hypothetical protein